MLTSLVVTIPCMLTKAPNNSLSTPRMDILKDFIPVDIIVDEILVGIYHCSTKKITLILLWNPCTNCDLFLDIIDVHICMTEWDLMVVPWVSKNHQNQWSVVEMLENLDLHISG